MNMLWEILIELENYDIIGFINYKLESTLIQEMEYLSLDTMPFSKSMLTHLQI